MGREDETRPGTTDTPAAGGRPAARAAAATAGSTALVDRVTPESTKRPGTTNGVGSGTSAGSASGYAGGRTMPAASSSKRSGRTTTADAKRSWGHCPPKDTKRYDTKGTTAQSHNRTATSQSPGARPATGRTHDPVFRHTASGTAMPAGTRSIPSRTARRAPAIGPGRGAPVRPPRTWRRQRRLPTVAGAVAGPGRSRPPSKRTTCNKSIRAPTNSPAANAAATAHALVPENRYVSSAASDAGSDANSQSTASAERRAGTGAT